MDISAGLKHMMDPFSVNEVQLLLKVEGAANSPLNLESESISERYQVGLDPFPWWRLAWSRICRLSRS